jgi:nitrogen regulatory protein PII
MPQRGIFNLPNFRAHAQKRAEIFKPDVFSTLCDQPFHCPFYPNRPVLAASGAVQATNREGKISVKLIIAAIRPFKLEEVREALTTIGVRGMMVTEIKGFGAQSGHTEIYRGAEYAVNFVPKVKLELVVPAAMADQAVETIRATARTDKIGDGKIFVLDVAQAMRVRTGETNEDAI